MKRLATNPATEMQIDNARNRATQFKSQFKQKRGASGKYRPHKNENCLSFLNKNRRRLARYVPRHIPTSPDNS